MTDLYGPAGKRLERPTHDEQLERYERAFGFQREPEPEPEPEPIEASWGDTNRKSMYGEYYRRHPETRPKPRELTKFETTKIAPDVTVADYLPRLLEQLKSALENYAIFQDKIDALEAKVDPCVKSHGKNFRMIDQECIELDSHFASQPSPENKTKSEPTTIGKLLGKTVLDCSRWGCLERGKSLHIHQGVS